jgi:para-nitrobenzyl esterase
MDANVSSFDSIGSLPQSEDCLNLNIWTSSTRNGEKRPVMVWLHGGGFEYGTAVGKIFDGTALAKRGIVLVSLHHSSMYSVLHLPEIMGKIMPIWRGRNGGRSACSNGSGTLNHRWRPGNVTIFAIRRQKASLLMGMLRQRTFHRAIVESSLGLKAKEPENAGTALNTVATLGIGAGQIDKLQNIPAQQLLDTALSLPPEQFPSGMVVGVALMNFTPVVDGYYIPAHPFHPSAAPSAAAVPLLIGTNRDESALFG